MITQFIIKMSKNIVAIRELSILGSKLDIQHSAFLVTKGEAVQIKIFDDASLRLQELGCLFQIEWHEAIDYAPTCMELSLHSIHHNFYLIRTEPTL